MQIVIITGMSGAGKSSGINIFEDMGYYSMDNVPPQLISNFVQLTENSKLPFEKLVVGVDIRGGIFFDDLEVAVAQLKQEGHQVIILFLDANDEVLVRRFKELRRPHPLGGSGDMMTEIKEERRRLKRIQDRADITIDTSALNLGKLREAICTYFQNLKDTDFFVRIISFGFKNGILLDGDLIFDVRFIPNPYYIESLREMNGLDQTIEDYVFQFEQTNTAMNKIVDLVTYLLPMYKKEGKRGLTIGIGCTGGKHRSVSFAHVMYQKLRDLGIQSVLFHRDEEGWENHGQ